MSIQVQAEIRAKKRAQASSLADESLSTDAEAHEEAQFLTENKRFKGAQDTLWWTLIIQPGYIWIPFELIWRIQDC